MGWKSFGGRRLSSALVVWKMAILAIFAFRTFAFALVLFARLYVLVLTASCITMTSVDKVLAILCTSSLIGTSNASARASWRWRSTRLAISG